MSSNVKPGEDGEELSPDDEIRRVVLVPDEYSAGQVLPNAFTLSKKEKTTARKSTSAWEAELTSRKQSVALTSNTRRKCVVTFPVSLLHGISGALELEFTITAVWEPLEDQRKPGADGHCGIVGLRPEPYDKTQTKNIRAVVADAVNEHHDIVVIDE